MHFFHWNFLSINLLSNVRVSVTLNLDENHALLPSGPNVVVLTVNTRHLDWQIFIHRNSKCYMIAFRPMKWAKNLLMCNNSYCQSTETAVIIAKHVERSDLITN